MAIVLNTCRHNSSPCDVWVGIFSSNVQLYYLIMDRILCTSCVAAKLVSRTVDLSFVSFLINVTVALRGLDSWLLLTLCRRLIHHFKTCTSCLFPHELGASPAESEKLASLDGTFAFVLSKTTFRGISSPVGRQITCTNVPSPVIFALDATPVAWRPP